MGRHEREIRPGLTVAQLARLTGQTKNTVFRKLNASQGMRLGPREAFVIAVHDAVDDATWNRILAGLPDDDTGEEGKR